ncbi:MAG: LytTR family DNA-binding domain-containing protein [Bacteroidota bacterium]
MAPTLPIDYSLDKLIQVIDPKQFFRISRQFIVSLNSIHMIHTVSAGKLKLHLIPGTKQEVAVSGDRVSDFKEWLGKD